MSNHVPRCSWCGSDPLYVTYHDEEWGVPEYDDQKLFEMLILEGAQAGLSWSTILHKREGYRSVFHQFIPEKVALMTAEDCERLQQDSRIVRNRLKIASTVTNAHAFLKVQQEFGTFSEYLWAFVDGKPRTNSPRTTSEILAQTPDSIRLSKDLKRRGFKFVGPTIVYAYMQAVGMVNDHITSCFLYDRSA